MSERRTATLVRDLLIPEQIECQRRVDIPPKAASG